MKKTYLLLLLLFSNKALTVGPILQAYCTHMWLDQHCPTWSKADQRLFSLGSLFYYIRSVNFLGLYCAGAVIRKDITACKDPFQSGIKFSCYINALHETCLPDFAHISDNVQHRRLFINTIEDEILYDALTTDSSNFDKTLISWLQEPADEREFIFGETSATIQTKHNLLVHHFSTRPFIVITIARDTHTSFSLVSGRSLDQWVALLPYYTSHKDSLAAVRTIFMKIRSEIFAHS